jgi:putative peptidoglycan lipid II flippase
LEPAFSSVPLYILKLSCLSALAAIPVFFLSPVLLTFFEGKGRIISYGIPLTINATIYIFLGLIMLVIVKDKYLLALIKMLRKKEKIKLEKKWGQS